MSMFERLGQKLTEKEKKQLQERMQECIDHDVFILADWMKIYDIMVDALHRESIAKQEEYLAGSITEGDVQ